MAQLVVAAAGAVVGFAVGGPTGAKWGWMAGSLIGAAFTPAQKSEGPRLSDLSVGSSAYGTALPYLEGSARMSGQVVWASAKRELATTTSQGKGGGAETTSYSYEIDLFILLTDNEIADVTRIWSNGKLIWSIADGVSLATLEASGNTNRWSRMTVYDGNASQLPDPDYEAAVGTANAPAYRGRGTVFIKSLGLGSSGMVPNLTFETTCGLGPHAAPLYLGATPAVSNYSEAIANVDPSTGWIWALTRKTSSKVLEVTVVSDRGQAVVANLSTSVSTNMTPQGVVYVGNYEVWVLASNFPTNRYALIFRFSTGSANPDGSVSVAPAFIDSFHLDKWEDGTSSGVPIDPSAITWDASTGQVWVSYSFSNITWLTVASVNVLTRRVSYEIEMGSRVGFPEQILAHAPYVAVLGWGGGGDNFVIFNGVTRSVLYTFAVSYGGYNKGCDFDTRRKQYVFAQRNFTVIDAATGVKRVATLSIAPDHDVAPPTWPFTPIDAVTYQAALDRYVFGQTNNGIYGTSLYVVNPDSLVTEKTLTYEADPVNAFKLINPLLSPASSRRYVLSFDNGQVKRLYLYGNSVAAVSLQNVVEHLCIRAGLSSQQFDASALASITLPVQSMAVTQVSSARTILETLASCYFFEAVLSDKIYFRPRGGASVATLPFADLATANDVNAKTEPLPLKQTNALEIPAQMALTHSNILNDYLPDTQWSDRLLTGQENTSAVQVPLGFEPSQAKAITDSLLLDKVVSGLQTSFSVPRRYAKLEPTDVVMVQDEDGSSYRLRLMRKKEADGVLTFDAVLDDMSILSQSGTTSSTATGQTEVAAVPWTSLRLLDCPLLNDLDDSPGHYLALSAQASPWPGAAVYASWDNTNFATEASLTSQTVLGSCTSVLGAWAQGDQMDESNWFTVSVVQGELASVSREVLLADRSANAALVGAELLQFQNALLLSPGVYRLSGLLRGRRGTEYAQASHGAAEDFVLLGGSGLLHVALQSGDLGRTRYYKGVTAGQRVSAVTAQSLSLAGVSSRCLSPVNARANCDSADTVLTWTRRTRYATRLTGAFSLNAPLGEVSEAYEIEVYSSSAFSSVLRTLSSSSPSVSYSLAQQLLDFGSAPSVLYLRLYQLSATTGRGYALQATL